VYEYVSLTNEISAIANQLRFKLQNGCKEHEGDAESSRKHADSMSILDKMSIWESKASDECLQPDTLDCFEGVDDLEDVEQTDFSVQSKAIVGTMAYEWLISSLLKASNFHWAESQPGIVVDAIRKNVLEKLPTGRISKSRNPRTYQVAFQLPWLSLESRLKVEGTTQSILGKPAIADLLVLTCSSTDQVQATTVRQYLEQTWPSGGTALLSILQSSIDGTWGNIFSGNSSVS
jgi:hypothetical protein